MSVRRQASAARRGLARFSCQQQDSVRVGKEPSGGANQYRASIAQYRASIAQHNCLEIDNISLSCSIIAAAIIPLGFRHNYLPLERSITLMLISRSLL